MQPQDSRQFVAKLDELPPEVEYYLLSDELLKNLADLGPKIVVITDGKIGSYGFDGQSYYYLGIFRLN